MNLIMWGILGFAIGGYVGLILADLYHKAKNKKGVFQMKTYTFTEHQDLDNGLPVYQIRQKNEGVHI